MVHFIRDYFLYKQLKKGIIRRAEILCQQFDLTAEDLLIEAFKKANIGAIGDAITGGKRTMNHRTPITLKPFLEDMLVLEPELSAWLIVYKIGKAIIFFGLPIELQGDIQMAFECANYFLPKKTDKIARHLAYALCIMPSLWLARSTLRNLGVPAGDNKLSDEEAQSLINQGYLPPDVKAGTGCLIYPGWNMEMRRTVIREIENISSENSRLFQIARMRESQKKALSRWKRVPDHEASNLLDEGIDLADKGQFDKACKLLDKAAAADSMLIPDAFRNKAWIFSKQKRYNEAIDLCYQALKIDPEYAEIWYHLGICLAQVERFSEALNAFEKAKSLGFRSYGLKPNMATCRRAISHGLF